MWIIYALIAAFFAGLVSVLAKIGIKNTDSNLAMALRTIVVVGFAWLLVFVVGSYTSITTIAHKSLLFLILSGLSTGGSWIYYFKALQIGDVNKVVPVDKSSTILTMLLSICFIGEEITVIKICAMIMIGAGTYLMIERKETVPNNANGCKWLFYAVLSAVFASLTAVFGKVGIEGVESNLGTAIRTVVVMVMAWLIVFMQGKQKEIKRIGLRSWWFIGLSGLATGLSWLFYYRALQEGPASVVVPIDKLSILVTVGFAYFVLHEKLKKQSAAGLAMLLVGTLSLLI